MLGVTKDINVNALKKEDEAYMANFQRTVVDLVHNDFYDELVIIGFPYDQGAKFLQLRAGAYLGPDGFRKTLEFGTYGVLKNFEYGIDIEKYLPKISDYGNIQTDSVVNGQKTVSAEQLDELYKKLQKKVGLCLDRNNITFTVGGTKDMFPWLRNVYSDYSKNKTDT